MAKQPQIARGKSGVTSTSKTLSESRHGFEPQPATRRAAGAFGKEERVRPHVESSRGAVDDSKRRAGRRMKKSG